MAAALNLANQTGTSVFHERQTRDRHLAVIGQQYGGKTHIDPVLDRSGCVTDHLRTLGITTESFSSIFLSTTAITGGSHPRLMALVVCATISVPAGSCD